MDESIIASITRRHGAYLISFDHHEFITDVATPIELYDAAGSLAKAKRLAKADAKGAGFTHLRWVPGPELGHAESLLLVGQDPPDRQEDDY